MRSLAAMWRTRPSSESSEDATGRPASCSPVRAAHLCSSVARWKSSQLSSLARSSARWGGFVRSAAGAIHVMAENRLTSPPGPLLGEQLIGADPVGVVVGDGGDDQFVGFGGVAEAFQLVDDLARVSDELRVDTVGDQLTVRVGPPVAAGLLGDRELNGTL